MCAEGIAPPAVAQWSKQGREMFPVEHSLSFQPEGFSLLRSLRNGGHFLPIFGAMTSIHRRYRTRS